MKKKWGSPVYQSNASINKGEGDVHFVVGQPINPKYGAFSCPECGAWFYHELKCINNKNKE